MDSLQEAYLAELIAAVPVGERFNAATLWTTLDDAEASFNSRRGNNFDRWYSRTMKDQESPDSYLRESPRAADLGIRALDDGVFIRTAVEPLSRTTIVVDASNVAWGPRSEDRYADWAAREPAVGAQVLKARVSFRIVEGSVEFSPRIP